MSFANRRRVKEMLELTFPGFKDRNDKDERVDRLLASAHQKVRFTIEKSGGTMPVYIENAAFVALTAAIAIAALTTENRQLRFRLKDAAGFGSSPLTLALTGVVDGIETVENILIDENGEFVSKTAWTSVTSPVVATNLPATPGTIQVIESVDAVLGQIEEWKAACLYLIESGDRYVKEAEAPEREDFCDMARKALKAWIDEEFKSVRTDPPIYFRASS